MLSIEQAIEKLQKEYPRGVDLFYVDYRDDLEDQPKAIQQIMSDGLWDLVYELRDATDNLYEVMKEVFDHEELDYINDNDDLREAIYNWIDDNNTSDVLRNLSKNTRPIPIRIPMYSNYDCINSLSIADLSYPNSYLADVIDTLEINPRDVFNILSNDLRLLNLNEEPWPDMPERNPYISAKDFVSELQENERDGLRTFVGLLDIGDCIYKGLPETITIPAGNHGGFFASGVGSGSCIESPLLRDITINLTESIHPNLAQYKKWVVLNDTDPENGYNISDVYGPMRKFYTEEIILHHINTSDE